jgi:hypothetical protein
MKLAKDKNRGGSEGKTCIALGRKKRARGGRKKKELGKKNNERKGKKVQDESTNDYTNNFKH